MQLIIKADKWSVAGGLLINQNKFKLNWLPLHTLIIDPGAIPSEIL